jgi:uncharacterized protein (UPF0261 family)
MSVTLPIAVTVGEGTEPGATSAADHLRHAGWATQLFQIEDGGGQAFESFLKKGQALAVLDYTVGDLAEARLRGTASMGANRLTSASAKALPQVIVPGGLDSVSFRSRIPSSHGERPQFSINAYQTLVRTTAEDNDAFGKEIAFKAAASKGPVAVVVPRGGLSEWDGPGLPLDDPLANKALVDSLYHWRSPDVEVIESERHINDYLFAQIAAERLMKMLNARPPARRK